MVVDTHPGYDDRTMAMLTLANEILLVVTPEVGSLRNSSQFLGLAREVGLGDIIRVVVNRANHGIRLPDIEDVLKLPVSATVVSNGPKAIIASNEGHAGGLEVPEREDLDGPAQRRAHRGPGQRPRGQRPEQRRSWWSTLVSRTSNA